MIHPANRWRLALADLIETRRGYDRYPFSWNVAVYEGIDDFYSLLKDALAHAYGPGAGADIDAKLLADIQEEWNKTQDETYNWVIEDMQRSVTDDDTYKTIRPEVATAHELVDLGFTWEVAWKFRGRGGKHLTMVEFEGANLQHLEIADLQEDDVDDGEYAEEWCQKLAAMVAEADLCFTAEKVKDEFKYQTLYLLATQLQEAADETEELRKEAAEALFWRERGVQTLGE